MLQPVNYDLKQYTQKINSIAETVNTLMKPVCFNEAYIHIKDLMLLCCRGSYEAKLLRCNIDPGMFLLHAGKIYLPFLLSVDFFQNYFFFENSFRNIIMVSEFGSRPDPTKCRV